MKIVDNSRVFADVPSDSWSAQAVAFTSGREIFLGTGPDTFSPDASMTRGMIVTVLARVAGVDTAGGEAWYTTGRDWAMANGISDGTNLDQNLSREQLAAMLWRYAGCPDAAADMSGYADAAAISGYAHQAMAWCVEQGILVGTTETTLSPQSPATRAQVATVLMRAMKELVS